MCPNIHQYFPCNHVLQVPLAWPWLVREYQRLSPPGHWLKNQSRLHQWPTEGCYCLTAVGWVTWQGVLSRSDGDLSNADWVSLHPFEQRKVEMTEQKRNCITGIIQYVFCRSKLGFQVPFIRINFKENAKASKKKFCFVFICFVLFFRGMPLQL